MTIEIICVGKLKESYWRDAIAEYSKRLGRFCRLEIVELAESRLPDKAGAAEEQAVIKAESDAILAKLGRGSGGTSSGRSAAGGVSSGRGASGGQGGAGRSAAGHYVVALDVLGKRLDSPGLAEKIASLQLDGKSKISFVIGGSLGLSQELLKAADFRLSFSDMTFPHQLMRVILLEQIYRAFKINANETYHK